MKLLCVTSPQSSDTQTCDPGFSATDEYSSKSTLPSAFLKLTVTSHQDESVIMTFPFPATFDVLTKTTDELPPDDVLLKLCRNI